MTSIFDLCGSVPFVGSFAKKIGELIVDIMNIQEKEKLEETKQKMKFLTRYLFSEEQMCY